MRRDAVEIRFRNRRRGGFLGRRPAVAGAERDGGGKVSVVADWFSGKNFWGYFTPGISVTLPHSGLLNIGYALGNDSYDGNKNRAFFIYYGITFP